MPGNEGSKALRLSKHGLSGLKLRAHIFSLALALVFILIALGLTSKFISKRKDERQSWEYPVQKVTIGQKPAPIKDPKTSRDPAFDQAAYGGSSPVKRGGGDR